MTNILITGMTPAQSKRDARSKSYADQLVRLLAERDVGNVLQSPTNTILEPYHLDGYDAIFVGISPVLGLGSNFSYGALKLINMAWGDPRLHFFVDAPLPSQIMASLRAIDKRPEDLIKPLFQKRPGYAWAVSPEGLSQGLEAVQKLLTGAWPTTIYPELPWASEAPTAFPNPVGLNLDSASTLQLLSSTTPRLDYWAADNPKSRWVAKAQKNMQFGVAPMRPTRFATDLKIAQHLNRMAGALIAPQRDGTTWWTPRYLQSLAVHTPVVTEWRESGAISEHWAIVPSAIEEMSSQERALLAERQRFSYLLNVPTIEESASKLGGILGIAL